MSDIVDEKSPSSDSQQIAENEATTGVKMDDKEKKKECKLTLEPVEESRKTARFMVENVDSPTRSPTKNDSFEYTYPDPSADTIGFPTHEAVPMTVFYRNQSSIGDGAAQRPTLKKLHQGLDELDEENMVIIMYYLSQERFLKCL